MANLPQLNISYGSYMPKSYSQDLFRNVTAFDTAQQKENARQFSENMGAMGRAFTGSALRAGIESLYGSANDRTQQLINQIAIQGAETGAREGEATTAFDRGMEQMKAGQEWQSVEYEKNRQFQASQAELDRQFQKKMYKKQHSLGSMLKSGVAGGISNLPGAVMGGVMGMGARTMAQGVATGAMGSGMSAGTGTGSYGLPASLSLGYGTGSMGYGMPALNSVYGKRYNPYYGE